VAPSPPPLEHAVQGGAGEQHQHEERNAGNLKCSHRKLIETEPRFDSTKIAPHADRDGDDHAARCRRDVVGVALDHDTSLAMSAGG
jgi:hypothetical protein